MRTYAGHADRIRAALQTLLASARAAGRSGLVLETRLLNTDPRPLGQCFLRQARTTVRRGDRIHASRYVNPAWFAAPHQREAWAAGEDWG